MLIFLSVPPQLLSPYALKGATCAAATPLPPCGESSGEGPRILSVSGKPGRCANEKCRGNSLRPSPYLSPQAGRGGGQHSPRASNMDRPLLDGERGFAHRFRERRMRVAGAREIFRRAGEFHQHRGFGDQFAGDRRRRYGRRARGRSWHRREFSRSRRSRASRARGHWRVKGNLPTVDRRCPPPSALLRSCRPRRPRGWCR